MFFRQQHDEARRAYYNFPVLGLKSLQLRQFMEETSFALDEKQAEAYRNFAGDGVFRLSVGLEDAEDLCRDLDQTMSIVGE